MSDIKIQPSATGSATVTLTAPATGTARTVTLPDSTDTLAVNSDVTNKLPLAGGTMTGNVIYNDNAKLLIGTGSDLEIYHDGSQSYIKNSGTGQLRLAANGILFTNAAVSENIMFGAADGAVTLYHNGGAKLDTSATGTSTTGTAYISRDVSNYATSAATAISTATLKLKTHQGDSTLTTFGGMSGGSTYIQRTNGSGSATYPIALNPYGGDVQIGAAYSSTAANGNFQRFTGTGGISQFGVTGTNNLQQIQFFNGNGSVGGIWTNGSATSYNTSSDYRLKENVDYTWDATTRLKQLKPARFNFIADDTNTLVDGFIAHEVSSVVPEAISGAKDAMTAEVLYVEGDVLPEGKNVGDVKEASVPDMQGIDQSKLVPLLVKTIQELEARITTLEG